MLDILPYKADVNSDAVIIANDSGARRISSHSKEIFSKNISKTSLGEAEYSRPFCKMTSPHENNLGKRTRHTQTEYENENPIPRFPQARYGKAAI
jgi:hypothetical protein